jgi:hypothetical protein
MSCTAAQAQYGSQPCTPRALPYTGLDLTYLIVIAALFCLAGVALRIIDRKDRT